MAEPRPLKIKSVFDINGHVNTIGKPIFGSPENPIIGSMQPIHDDWIEIYDEDGDIIATTKVTYITYEKKTSQST